MTTNATTKKTMSANRLFDIFTKDDRTALRNSGSPEDRIAAHVVYSTWQELQTFEKANREIERCRDRIARECATLNPRRDSDCVSMDWIASATHDLAKAIEQRNTAHRRATSALELMHDIGMLTELAVPDYNA